MNAKNARNLSEETKNSGRNYQRLKTLDRIKNAARVHGDTFIVLYEDEYRVRYTEEDYQYFEKLGYKVTRPAREYFIDKKTGQQMVRTEVGRIDW
jgi:hypothetical protein